MASKNILGDKGAEGQLKKSGIIKVSNKVITGQGYKSTEKLLIVGKSGSGKTTLAFELALNSISKYSSIVYICSHFNDNIVINFEKWTEKAAIPFYEISVDTKSDSLNIPNLTNALFIIDDYYTSSGRPKMLEKLIKELVNAGRHAGNHIIYIAHSPKYLPTEIIDNNSGVFVDRPYKKFPVSYAIDPENKEYWYKITNDALSDDATIKLVEFPEYSSEKDIIKKLKSKIPAEDKGKKLPDKNDYKAMGMQGNEYATKAYGVMKGKGKSISNKITPINMLPMFGKLRRDIDDIVQLTEKGNGFDLSKLIIP